MLDKYNGSWGWPGGNQNNTSNPVNLIEWNDHYPDIYDVNFNIGQQIINHYQVGGVNVSDLYQLIDKRSDGVVLGEKANWTLISSGSGELDSVRLDDNQIVYPNGGTIDIIGDATSIKTRKINEYTMQVYSVETPGDEFWTNDGNKAMPDPASGRLNIYGGSNITTATSSANTVQINLPNDLNLSGYIRTGDYIHCDQVITADNGIYVTAGGIESTGLTKLVDLGSTPGIVFSDNLGRLSSSSGTGSTGGWIPVSDSTGVITWKQIQQGAGSVTVVNDDINGITIGGGGGGGGGGTDGQISIGVTGGPAVLNTITAGAGITVTNGPGTITITNVGGGGGTGGATTFHTDEGVDANISLAGAISIFGSGSVVTTGSNPPLCGLVSISLKDDVEIVTSLNLNWVNHIGVLQSDATGRVFNSYGNNGDLLVSGGTGPVWTSLVAGSGIAIDTSTPNTIVLSTSGGGGGASNFITNSGTATISGPNIKIYGGSNITTSGGTDTVTIDLSGPISVANGGTGVVSFGTAYAPVYVGAAKTTLLSAASAGTSGQLFQSKGGSSAPAYTTAIYPSSVTQGSILYGSATNVIDDLAKSTTATRYIANTGTSNAPKWDQINLANGVIGTLPASHGGTGNTTYTTDGIIYYNGSKMASTSAGIAGQVLMSSGAGSAPVWGNGTGGGGVWEPVSGTLVASPGHWYLASSAAGGLVLFTMPAVGTCTIGQTFRISSGPSYGQNPNPSSWVLTVQPYQAVVNSSNPWTGGHSTGYLTLPQSYPYFLGTVESAGAGPVAVEITLVQQDLSAEETKETWFVTGQSAQIVITQWHYQA